MINGVGAESESWLLGILNRVVRCSHRHHSRPITPRGGGQSYAVCLDCGTRFAYDLNAMRVETSVPGSSLDEENIPDIPEDERKPCAPSRHETMRYDSRWRRRDIGTVVVLCLGAMSLVGAFLYSPNRPAATKRFTSAEQARPSLPADSVKSSPGLPVQESGTEMALAPQPDTLAAPTVSTKPEPITEPKPIESDSTSAPPPPRANRVLRLEGKGSVIVLGRKAVVALELAQHPERLRKLIRRGALFTVPPGTPIKLVQGNRLGNRLVIKVRIMEGSRVGQEGWAQTSQVSQ
jgi:hypothetical protein